MIVLMDGLTDIQWHEELLALLPAPASDGIGLLHFQPLLRPEQVRVVRHVEHAQVADRPCVFENFAIVVAVHENGQALVNRGGEFGIASRAEDGRCAGVGIDQRKLSRRERKYALAFMSAERWRAAGRQCRGLSTGEKEPA